MSACRYHRALTASRLRNISGLCPLNMRTSSGINQSEHVDRARRVAEFVQREVSELIRTEFDDPRLDLVTVTDVRVSKDLRHARVFVSKADFIAGLKSGSKSDGKSAHDKAAVDAKRKKNSGEKQDRKQRKNAQPEPDYVEALNRASARIRRLLARRMTTKTTPRLQFEFDRALDQGHRISSILESISTDPASEPVT